MVIVEFPNYRGPPLLKDPPAAAEHPNLVPIVAVTLKCDRWCCTRTALPLVCGKCDTVHSAQGISIGRGRPLQRCVFRFSAKAESIFAGIFYVGCSRVEDESCLAFDAPFTRVVAEKVGNYETSRQARMAMQKVARLAARQRQRHV
eukprot:COSAG02_NODE_14019_length_1320_cov_11.550369_1_plen_146_part_00